MFCQTCDLTNANMRLLALLDMLKVRFNLLVNEPRLNFAHQPVAEFNRKVKNASNDLLSIVALDRNMVSSHDSLSVREIISQRQGRPHPSLGCSSAHPDPVHRLRRRQAICQRDMVLRYCYFQADRKFSPMQLYFSC